MNNSALANRCVLFILLFTTWVILSGHFTPFFLGMGAVCCLIVVATTSILPSQVQGRVHLGMQLLRAIPYAFWIFKEIFFSSLRVARLVWTPSLPIDPGAGWVPVRQKSDLALAILANTITLTPGTVSILVEGQRIYVHALEKSELDELRKGDVDTHVRHFMEGYKA